MLARTSLLLLACSFAALAPLSGCAGGGGRSSSARIETGLSSEAAAGLDRLCQTNPAAAALARDAKAVLVFPDMIKGGFVVGAFHGEGVMFKNGRIAGYYDSTGASYGLQAGVQSYSYALFFMKDSDLNYLETSRGWEIGSGPSVTVVDSGLARNLTSTTLREGVYCFFFDQKGLMAGLGIQGSKITRIDR
jgi:lipid-binding SYLF domain-containing protein